MAHDHVPALTDTKTTLEGLGPKVFMTSAVVGVLGIVAAVLLGVAQGDGLKHFGFTYLVNFAFFLSISLGALIFLGIQYVTKSSWSVVIRRLAEVMAAVMPLLAVLAIPVLILAGQIYGWATPEARTAHALTHKAAYLSRNWFVVRWVVYFVIWTGYSLFFWRNSVAQDRSGDLALTHKLENFSGFSLMIGALTIAAAAFDLLMSVDYLWFSTMFGVYYWGRRFRQLLRRADPGHHGAAEYRSADRDRQRRGTFHDYGKLMFAFTFFWGYIAFSQYMLYWYANVPEETVWFLRRSQGGWGWVGLVTLFATFLAPFAGLISRYAKRNRKMLAFWAVWIIVAQWINLYWVVMPEFSPTFTLGVMDLACFVGLGGLWLAAATRLAMGASLVPTRDPRLGDSLRFENA